VARLRRAAKRILVLSTHPEAAQVLEAFHQDGFRQAVRADSYQRARLLAEQGRFDLLVADLKVGTRWTRDLMAALADHGLLRDLPTILLVDFPYEGDSAMARPLGAAHVHVRGRGAGALVDAACALLGVE
jgi:CheY-like chemotaxis protein